MFTGIVKTTGKVSSIFKIANGADIVVDPKDEITCNIGDSICVSGVCLTVKGIKDNVSLFFNVSSETLKKTTLGRLKVGDEVNIELAVGVGDLFGGHLVSGHIDGTGRITSLINTGNEVRAKILAPNEVKEYLIPQGSVAVDGVSLTVANLSSNGMFEVVLIPHTLEVTNFSRLKSGSVVNLEADMIGKYVKKFIKG